MEKLTICHPLPDPTAQTMSRTRPAMLRSVPMPWLILLAISSPIVCRSRLRFCWLNIFFCCPHSFLQKPSRNPFGEDFPYCGYSKTWANHDGWSRKKSKNTLFHHSMEFGISTFYESAMINYPIFATLLLLLLWLLSPICLQGWTPELTSRPSAGILPVRGQEMVPPSANSPARSHGGNKSSPPSRKRELPRCYPPGPSTIKTQSHCFSAHQMPASAAFLLGMLS
jgi:hypothetical protein